jgi:ABC-type transport system involved in multi-copper enzyme maturation permease subunit
VTALIRSELRKVLTTNTWWLMLLGVVGFTVIALLVNVLVVASATLNGDPQSEQFGLGNDAAGLASYVYTSGQYFGTLFVMLLGALIVTNEYHHQTATPTFLATPRRVRVIVSKLVGAVGIGVAFGLVTMLISVPVGALYLSAHGVGSQLDQPTVLATLGLNLLAYAIWAVFGVGIGTLLRNQIAALVVCLVLKLVAEQAVGLVLTLLSDKLDQHWIMNLMWALPSQASTVMTTATRIPDAPVWYVGALILLAYGLVAGGLGSLITRRRDIT